MQDRKRDTFTLLKYTVQWYFVYPQLSKYHYSLILKHFTHSPQRKTIHICSSFLTSLPFSQPLATTNLLSVSINLPSQAISYERYQKNVTLFHPAQCFKIYTCCSMYHYFFLFYCHTISHWVDMPHFVYSLIG